MGVNRIIRGGEARRLRPAPVTPLHELSLLGEDGARMEAAIDEARTHGYHDGHAAGYRDGWDAGERAARASVAAVLWARIEPVLTALRGATADLAERDAVRLEEIEPELIGLVLSMTEALLGRELACAPSPVRDAMRRALAFVPDRGEVTVFVHPDDADTIGAVDDLVPGRDLRFVGSATVERGACIVDVGACRVDAQLAPALERVRSVLRTAKRADRTDDAGAAPSFLSFVDDVAGGAGPDAS